MDHELTVLLQERRDRAEPVPAAHTLIAAARAESRRRSRRRRTATATVGTSIMVGAVAAGSLALASSSDHASLPAPVPPGGVSAPPSISAPAPTPTPSDSTPAKATLVLPPPAPAAAPLSLGFLPDGWAYDTSEPGYTDYRPTAGDGGVIRVMAERRLPDTGNPPRENTRAVLGIPTTVQHYIGACVPDYPCDPQAPANATRVVQAFGDVSPGERPVDVVYVVPDRVGLTQDQLLRMISGTDVRDLTHPVG